MSPLGFYSTLKTLCIMMRKCILCFLLDFANKPKITHYVYMPYCRINCPEYAYPDDIL